MFFSNNSIAASASSFSRKADVCCINAFLLKSDGWQAVNKESMSEKYNTVKI